MRSAFFSKKPPRQKWQNSIFDVACATQSHAVLRRVKIFFLAILISARARFDMRRSNFVCVDGHGNMEQASFQHPAAKQN